MLTYFIASLSMPMMSVRDLYFYNNEERKNGFKTHLYR